MKLNDEVKYKHSKTGITYKIVEVWGGWVIISPLYSDIRIGALVEELVLIKASKPLRRPTRGRKGTKVAR